MMSRIPGVLGAVCALLLVALSPAQANDTTTSAGADADQVEVGSADAPPIEATPGEEAEPMGEPTPGAESYADSDFPVPDETEPETVAPISQPARSVALGEIGYDDQGRQGRIHIVVDGDTLWDISDAYLGTPWVWPSIWTDNRDIQNPHLILPKDRIWISRYEMRRVTAEEAEQLLAGGPTPTDMPAALEDEPEGDPLPRTFRVSFAESGGFVTSQELETSASVIDSVSARVMMVQPDEIYIGLGESEVSVGDQFTIFRTDAKIFDPDTGRLLGYHVNVLGWAEVTKPAPETSIVEIRQSNAEIEAGDRIIPRIAVNLEIEVVGSPGGVEGQIAFLPNGRGLMSTSDLVYLNRGEMDGLAIGNELAVYREGWDARENARDVRVEIPDRRIADLLVVTTRPETSVALITHTETEIARGDRFRSASAFAPASMDPASMDSASMEQ